MNRIKFEMRFSCSSLSQMACLGCQHWLTLLFPRITEDQDHHRNIKLHSDHENPFENVSCSENSFSQFCYLKDVWVFHNLRKTRPLSIAYLCYS